MNKKRESQTKQESQKTSQTRLPNPSSHETMDLVAPPMSFIQTAGGNTIQAQADRLNDSRVRGRHSRKLANQIGKTQGNQHLLKVITTNISLQKDKMDNADYMMPAEFLADESKRTDIAFAYKEGAYDGLRIEQEGLTSEIRRVVNSKLRFFKKFAYTSYGIQITSSIKKREKTNALRRDQQIRKFILISGISSENDTFDISPYKDASFYIEKKFIKSFETGVDLFWDNYRSGLDNFSRRMNLSIPKDNNETFMDRLLKKPVMFVFNTAVSKTKIATVVKGIQAIYEGFKDAFSTWSPSNDASGKEKISEYVESLNSGIGELKAMTKDKLEKKSDLLFAEYRSLENSGKPNEKGEIFGNAAQYLNKLKSNVENFRNAMKAQTASVFRQKFTESFIDMNLKPEYPLSWNGALWMFMKMKEVKENFDYWTYGNWDFSRAQKEKKWSVKKRWNYWKLVTDAPEPDNVAKNLEVSLRNQNKLPHQANIPKNIWIESDKSSWDVSEWAGTVTFTNDPNSLKADSQLDKSGNVQKIWNEDEIKQVVLNTKKIKGAKNIDPR